MIYHGPLQLPANVAKNLPKLTRNSIAIVQHATNSNHSPILNESPHTTSMSNSQIQPLNLNKK